MLVKTKSPKFLLTSSALPECKLFIQQTSLKLYILGSSTDQVTSLCVILGFRFEVDESWVITQRAVVISYQSFWANYRSHLQGSS